MAWETGCRSALIENSRDAVKAKYAEQSDDVTKLMFTKMYLIFWRVVFTEKKVEQQILKLFTNVSGMRMKNTSRQNWSRQGIT